METFTIGNSVDGIIRSYCAGKIGTTTMKYANQPYTTFSGAEASIRFKDISKESRVNYNITSFNHSSVSEIQIKSIPLTEKVLNLIYARENEALCYKTINCLSNDSCKVFLPQEDKYQIFIYGEDGELESAYGFSNESSLSVEQPNSEYLVIYSYPTSQAFKFSQNENFYITLDLKVKGNVSNSLDERTQDMFMHFDKCAVKVDREMLFSGQSNTIDLTFVVLDEQNYITLK